MERPKPFGAVDDHHHVKMSPGGPPMGGKWREDGDRVLPRREPVPRSAYMAHASQQIRSCGCSKPIDTFEECNCIDMLMFCMLHAIKRTDMYSHALRLVKLEEILTLDHMLTQVGRRRGCKVDGGTWCT